MFELDDGYDGADLDIGYYPRCGCNMRNEPPAALICSDCWEPEDC